MRTSTFVGLKSRGRPRVNAKLVGVRLPPADLEALDSWIAAQPDPKPNRQEAIRRMLRAEVVKEITRTDND